MDNNNFLAAIEKAKKKLTDVNRSKEDKWFIGSMAMLEACLVELWNTAKKDTIPIEWIKNKIDETEDKLFELTKDKSRSYSLDEIFAFKDLDLYAYTLKKIYYDYTGEYYEGNHYMLREKENE